eukprot:15453497-Alexandrium_andersonii.AAC.1
MQGDIHGGSMRGDATDEQCSMQDSMQGDIPGGSMRGDATDEQCYMQDWNPVANRCAALMYQGSTMGTIYNNS